MMRRKNFLYTIAGLLFVVILLSAFIFCNKKPSALNTPQLPSSAEISSEPEPSVVAETESPENRTALEKLLDQEWPEEDLLLVENLPPIKSREQFMQVAASLKTKGFSDTFKKTYSAPLDEQGRYIVLNNHRAFKIAFTGTGNDEAIFLHYPEITSDIETPVIRVIPIKESSSAQSHGSSTNALAPTIGSITTEGGIELPGNALVNEGNYLVQVEPVQPVGIGPKRFFIRLEISE